MHKAVYFGLFWVTLYCPLPIYHVSVVLYLIFTNTVTDDEVLDWLWMTPRSKYYWSDKAIVDEKVNKLNSSYFHEHFLESYSNIQPECV